MTLESVIKLLRRECERDGGIRAFSRRCGVSPGHISRVLRGEKRPGDELLPWLGVEAVVTYRRADTQTVFCLRNQIKAERADWARRCADAENQKGTEP